MLQYNPSISGSLNITGSLIISNGMIGTVNGVDVQIFSSSINQVITGIQAATSSQEGRLGSVELFTSSTSARLNSIESITTSNVARLNSIEIVSASNIARLSSLETTSASVDTTNTTQNTRLTNLESITGSLATTGSNSFFGTQTFSGSVYIANDLIVQGSSSIQYITGSSVNIGTNIVSLNTANPSVRYAGLTMIDSGSIGGSGSFLYDSVEDEFIFVHRGDGTNVTSSHFVLGPETYNSLGNETYLTCNKISKGTGKEHLVDSNIFDNGTTICLTGNTIGTGTACFGSSITNTTNYSSVISCSPIGCFTTSCASSFLGGTFSGTTNYASTVACATTICSSGNTCFGGNTIINGCVGIGTATPTAKLHVYCAADVWHTKIGSACGELRIGGDTASGAVIQSYTPAGVVRDLYLQRDGGKIGIGTNSPASKVHIYASCAAGAGASNSNTILLIDSDNHQLIEMRTCSSAYGAMQGIAFTDNGLNAFVGYKEYTCQTAGTYGEALHLAFYDYSASDPNNGIYFGTSATPNCGVSKPLMFIKGNGCIGIGTCTPESTFHINGVNDGGYGGSLSIVNCGGTAGTSTGIDFGADKSTVAAGMGNAQIKVCNIGTGVGAGANASDMSFTTWNGSAFREGLRISCNGNIGIGVTAPSFLLEICGNTGDSNTGMMRLGSPTGATLRLGVECCNYAWIQSHGGKPLLINELGNNVIFFCQGGGSMGIGYASPANRLSVNGNINLGTSANRSYSGPSQYGSIGFPRGEILFSNTNPQAQLYLASNAYNNSNGVFAYRCSAQAVALGLDNGAFSILMGTSGTADVAVSWNTPLAIMNAGTICVGGVNVVNTSNNKAHTFCQLNSTNFSTKTFTFSGNSTGNFAVTDFSGIPSNAKAVQVYGWYHITGYGSGAGQGDHAVSWFGPATLNTTTTWGGPGYGWPNSESSYTARFHGTFVMEHDGDASGANMTNYMHYYGSWHTGTINVHTDGNIYYNLGHGLSGGTHYNALIATGYWI